jgi:3-dehydroquinate dehydratase II
MLPQRDRDQGRDAAAFPRGRNKAMRTVPAPSRTIRQARNRSAMREIHVLHGPNLNLLGRREPAIYGAATLAEIEAELAAAGAARGIELTFRQTNSEGELVTFVQEAGLAGAGVILNAGAYTHTSIALHDAIRASGAKVVEVHLSNIYSRESFRSHSFISPVALGGIFGFGALGYRLALEALLSLAEQNRAAS